MTKTIKKTKTAIKLPAVAALAVSALITAAAYAQTAARDALWQEPLGGEALAPALLFSNSATVPVDGGKVVSFNFAGAKLWEYKSGGRLTPYISRSKEGINYICKTNGEFAAINYAGDAIWKIKFNAPLDDAPIIGFDGRLFLFFEKKLLCLTKNGKKLWELPLATPLQGSPRLSGAGGVLAILKDKSLLEVSAFGKALVTPPPASSAAPFAALPLSEEKQSAFLITRKIKKDFILLLYENGSLTLMDGEEAVFQGRLPAAPIAAASRKDLAAIQLNNGSLVLWSSGKKKVLWNQVSRPGIGNPDKKAERIKIEFDDENSKIYVLSVSAAEAFSFAGVKFWSMRFEKNVVPPSYNGEGVLFASGADWILSAFKIKEDFGKNKSGAKAAQNAQNAENAQTYGLGTRLTSDERSTFNIFYGGDYLFLLEKAQKLIKNGGLGEEEPVVTSLLLEIITREDAALSEKLFALRLLSETGSPETASPLINMLKDEAEPALAAAMIGALASTGADSANVLPALFRKIILRPQQSRIVLLSLVKALASLCRDSSPDAASQYIALLVLLSENNFAPVKEKAIAALKELGGG